MTSWQFELDDSYQFVMGVDEAGRGSLAGPVVAASVILDRTKPILGLNDSKKLSESTREQLYDQIYTHALTVSVKAIDADIIDRINILKATLLAMKYAVIAAMRVQRADLVLIDGNQRIPDLTPDIHQQTVVDGDALVECIMAASIIAKVHRDRLMKSLDGEYPGYGFKKHKGYGTKEHLAALGELGPSIIHRKSYAPVRALVS